MPGPHWPGQQAVRACGGATGAPIHTGQLKTRDQGQGQQMCPQQKRSTALMVSFDRGGAGASKGTAAASVPCWIRRSGTLLLCAHAPWWSSCGRTGCRQSPGEVEQAAVLLPATLLPAMLWHQQGFLVTAQLLPPLIPQTLGS